MEDKCIECKTTEDLQQHHVVPRSRGGTKTVTLCHSCHMKAHGRDSKGLNQSRLIKEGLARAKARGAQLGAPNPIETSLPSAWKARRKQGDETALRYGKTIKTSREVGLSFRAIANKLNTLNIPMPSGKSGGWTGKQAKRIHDRFIQLDKEGNNGRES